MPSPFADAADVRRCRAANAMYVDAVKSANMSTSMRHILDAPMRAFAAAADAANYRRRFSAACADANIFSRLIFRPPMRRRLTPADA